LSLPPPLTSFGSGLLELATDHLVHVHEEADSLAYEIVFASHAPRDVGLIASRFEGELDWQASIMKKAGTVNRAGEIQTDAVTLVLLSRTRTNHPDYSG